MSYRVCVCLCKCTQIKSHPFTIFKPHNPLAQQQSFGMHVNAFHSSPNQKTTKNNELSECNIIFAAIRTSYKIQSESRFLARFVSLSYARSLPLSHTLSQLNKSSVVIFATHHISQTGTSSHKQTDGQTASAHMHWD